MSSFLIGSLAGAVTTGGIFYGFSNLIQTRTAQHRHDLHMLSAQLGDASAALPGPPTASTRIAQRPFVAMLQAGWNEHIASMFATASGWERRASDWTKKVLYGGAS